MTQNNMPPAGTTPAQRPVLERIKKLSKLLNYLFYPVHLLILGLLRFYFNI